MKKRRLLLRLLPVVFVFGFSGHVGAQPFRTQKLTDRCSRSVAPNRLDSSGHAVGKFGIEQKFFGDFNARVEYFLQPSFSETLGCRIFRGATDTAYILEVKRRDNFQEIAQKSRKASLSDSTSDQATSAAEQVKISPYNHKVTGDFWQTDTWALPISDRLADRLYAATKEGISTDAEPDPIIQQEDGSFIAIVVCDGAEATFRYVPDDNDHVVWILRYHEPEGKHKELSDLFRAMIADVEAGQFDEAKYLSMLN
ncbi:MAG: hypothetical protein K2G93_08780 [Rikenella sp.]|nr:hypothetical protein [Rikenella sp.]